MVDYVPRHGVAVEEARKDSQAEAEVNVSRENVDAYTIGDRQASGVFALPKKCIPAGAMLTSTSRATQTSRRSFFT